MDAGQIPRHAEKLKKIRFGKLSADPEGDNCKRDVSYASDQRQSSKSIIG